MPTPTTPAALRTYVAGGTKAEVMKALSQVELGKAIVLHIPQGARAWDPISRRQWATGPAVIDYRLAADGFVSASLSKDDSDYVPQWHHTRSSREVLGV